MRRNSAPTETAADCDFVDVGEVHLDLRVLQRPSPKLTGLVAWERITLLREDVSGGCYGGVTLDRKQRLASLLRALRITAPIVAV